MANIANKYHYFYKITNNLNGHFYYGVHNTNDLDDGYMGSGKRLHYAYKKYGIENFTKEILKYFDTSKEAFEYESEVVNEDLIKDDNCYNITNGGTGWQTTGLVVVRDINKNIFLISKEDEKYISGELVPHNKGFGLYRNKQTGKIEYLDSTTINKDIYEGVTKNKLLVKDINEKYFYVDENDERYLSGKLTPYWKGKHKTNESCKKTSKTLKSINFNKGEKNPQYGTCWINKDGNSIRVKKEELNKYLLEGWIKGRKYTENQLKSFNEKHNKIPKENKPGYNTIWIHNDILKKSIYIKKELLNEYISNGWEIGRKIKEYK